MSNKQLAPCMFGSSCSKGDDYQFTDPEREANALPFRPPSKCDSRGMVTTRPQSHTRRPQSVVRGSKTMPNRRSRTNSKNVRPNSKVRHSNPIKRTDHLPLSLEQIKENIQDLYEVCIVQFELFFGISKCLILGRYT